MKYSFIIQKLKALIVFFIHKQSNIFKTSNDIFGINGTLTMKHSFRIQKHRVLTVFLISMQDYIFQISNDIFGINWTLTMKRSFRIHHKLRVLIMFLIGTQSYVFKYTMLSPESKERWQWSTLSESSNYEFLLCSWLVCKDTPSKYFLPYFLSFWNSKNDPSAKLKIAQLCYVAL